MHTPTWPGPDRDRPPSADDDGQVSHDDEFDAWLIGRVEAGADLEDIQAEIDEAYDQRLEELRQSFDECRRLDDEAFAPELAEAEARLDAQLALDPEQETAETAEAFRAWLAVWNAKQGPAAGHKRQASE
jgi:hypothetical protein